SETFVVGASTIPVSKELLTLSSPYFERLFNANFREKENDVFEIEEVSTDDFRWFMDSFHTGIWEFSSMERALLALSYADRFELFYLHLQVFPYIKNYRLPAEKLRETLILCTKFKDNFEFIAWVLHQCMTEHKAISLLQECALEMPTSMMQTALKVKKYSFTK
ncbi:hypothetical protein PENTCL1PPCAC_19722, partial [Pristionchus entomophagus]